jgi:hypothetical protein
MPGMFWWKESLPCRESSPVAASPPLYIFQYSSCIGIQSMVYLTFRKDYTSYGLLFPVASPKGNQISYISFLRPSCNVITVVEANEVIFLWTIIFYILLWYYIPSFQRLFFAQVSVSPSYTRVYPKVSDWVHEIYAHLWYYSLRSNKKGYGGKAH